MRFELPSLKEFCDMLFETAFGDIPQSGYDAPALIRDYCDNNDHLYEFFQDPSGEYSNELFKGLIRTILNMCDGGDTFYYFDSVIINKDRFVNDPQNYRYDSVATGHNTLAKWVEGDPKKTGNKRLVIFITVLFTYILLTKEDAKSRCAGFLDRCLAVLGIEKSERYGRLYDFDPDTVTEKEKDVCPAVRVLLLSVFVLFLIIGNDDETAEKNVSDFRKLYLGISAPYLEVKEAMEYAERQLLRRVELCRPRSTSGILFRLKDLYVTPTFEAGAEPVARMERSAYGERMIICGDTGMGKSMFTNAVSLCYASKLLGETDVQTEEMSGRIGAAGERFVIHVPAYMFSYSYQNHPEWTGDLAEMFFHCMWKISGTVDFYSFYHRDETGTDSRTGYVFSELLKEHIRDLAKRHRLLLILDGLDELSDEQETDKYLAAVRGFIKEYGSGTDIIMTSRHLPEEAMSDAENALRIGVDGRFEMCEFGFEQQKELIERWNRSGAADDRFDSEALLDSIRNNRYYAEYARNPYMLSVICSRGDDRIKNIIETFCETMIDKARSNYHGEDMSVRKIVERYRDILLDLALKSVENADGFCTSEDIMETVAAYYGTDTHEDDEDGQAIVIAADTFIKENGLIVPKERYADGYEFINKRVNYELASKKILQMKDIGKILKILHELSGTADIYAECTVPLICNCNTNERNERYIAVSVINDLINRYLSSGETRLREAVEDLVSGRYGTNILTAKDPAKEVREQIEGIKRIISQMVLKDR
ncbi:MAG: hypothetical protein J5744_02265 [Oscillospiraceae bacterium]|nr:hypothetical protein [Oscillospiraceae bacterium]